MFIDAYLGLTTGSDTGTATEASHAGYARVPVSFGLPRFGVATNATRWGFAGLWGAEPIAGRAIYDAPTGGNLLLVLPFDAARPIPPGPGDHGEPGDLVLTLAALAAFENGAAFTGTLAAGAVVGTVYDRAAILGHYSDDNTVPAGVTAIVQPGGTFLYARATPLSTGTQALVLNRGVLQTLASMQGAA